MTGQVKEEIVARFGELGIRLRGGRICLRPSLLRAREFGDRTATYSYVDIGGGRRELELPRRALAFTYCQVPVVYVCDEQTGPCLEVIDDRGRGVFNGKIIVHSGADQTDAINECFR